MMDKFIYSTVFPCVYCRHRVGEACGRPVLHQATGAARPFCDMETSYIATCQFQRSDRLSWPGMCGQHGAFFDPVSEIADEWHAARRWYVTYPAPPQWPFWLAASAVLAILAALIAWGLS